MDLEGFRTMGVNYGIIERDTAQQYEFYENLCLDDQPKNEIVMNDRTPDQKRLIKLEINRIRMAERRAKETEQERALRLYKNKMRNKDRRASETPEQRADRNRKNMERNRERRMKQRMLSEQRVSEHNSTTTTTTTTTTPPTTTTITTQFPEENLLEAPRRVRYYINDLLKVEMTSSPPRELQAHLVNNHTVPGVHLNVPSAPHVSDIHNLTTIPITDYIHR